MTLYYEIHETTTEYSVYYEVRKVYNFLGLMTAFGGPCWVSKNSLYHDRDYADKSYSLEEAQRDAKNHADFTLDNLRKKKLVKSKVVQVVKFS